MSNIGDCKSRLLALPAELRVKIWALSLTHDDIPIDLTTAKGPSKALKSTCRQIRDETYDIYEEANLQYWSTGQFEIHCDTPEDLIECMSGSNLRQINYLKIYGRCESYFFTSGVWTCTQLCRTALATKMVGNNREIGVYTHLYSRCPHGTIYDARSDGNRSATIGWPDHCCDRICSPGNSRGCGRHSFVSIGSDGDIEKAQHDMGWKGLTKAELVGILNWYERVVKLRLGSREPVADRFHWW